MSAMIISNLDDTNYSSSVGDEFKYDGILGHLIY